MINHTKTFFVKHYLAASAFLLGVALSGLILCFYYSVNNDKKASDRNLGIAGVTCILALMIGNFGKNLEEKK
jgi:formate-dependent nitrite reductase membrane component NrfD